MKDLMLNQLLCSLQVSILSRDLPTMNKIGIMLNQQLLITLPIKRIDSQIFCMDLELNKNELCLELQSLLMITSIWTSLILLRPKTKPGKLLLYLASCKGKADLQVGNLYQQVGSL